VLDKSVLDELRELEGEDGELISQLVSLYTTKGKAKLDLIQKHIESGNFSDASLEAHALKGMSGNIGAMKMFECCQHIETLGKKTEINPKFDAIHTHLEEALKEFQVVLGELADLEK
jgi:HPt (histidine-containing phosphotransfer) domain-containing protein